jgi:SSS family transporter
MIKLSIVLIYVAAMLAVGYWSMRRTKTVSDFFIGGRTLGPWLSAFAYGTTYFSAVLFIGYAGKLGWGFGLHTMWIVIGNALVGSFLAWKLIAGPTRRMTARLNALTMPTYLEARYQSPTFRLIAALIIFVFLVPYSASVYMGLSYLFEGVMGIAYWKAAAFMAGLTGVYIIMGGYLALAVTDLIRGIVEIVGVIIMVLYIAAQKGGIFSAASQLMTPEYAPGLGAPGPIPGWVTLACLVFITSFGPWGLPQMVQKFYSIKSELDIKAAMIVCTLFSVGMAFGAYFTGAMSHLFYTPAQVKEMSVDKLMPMMLTEHVPATISMIILVLVFSASMSSLSSLVLVSSSAIAIDLYQGKINPNAKKEHVMILMRVLCGVFVAISLYIALAKPTFIVNLMILSWGALAGSFLGPFLYGLFWKRTTRAGAMAGMICGVSIAVLIPLVNFLRGVPLDKFVPVAGALAMIAPLIVIPIVSLMTPRLPEAHIENCFGASIEGKE